MINYKMIDKDEAHVINGSRGQCFFVLLYVDEHRLTFFHSTCQCVRISLYAFTACLTAHKFQS